MKREQRVEPVVSQKGSPYVNPSLNRFSTPKTETMTTFMTSNKAVPREGRNRRQRKSGRNLRCETNRV